MQFERQQLPKKQGAETGELQAHLCVLAGSWGS